MNHSQAQRHEGTKARSGMSHVGARLSIAGHQPDADCRNVQPTTPPSTLVRRLNVVALLLIGVFSAAAAADTFLLIDEDLSLAPVELRSVSDDRVRFEDRASGHARERSFDRVLALLRREVTIEPPRSAGWLTLADGQRFPGTPSETLADDERSFAWEHDSFGRVTVPIDSIASVQFDPEMNVPEPSAGDVVLLRNGDTLEGFLIMLGDRVVIEVSDGGRSEMLTIDRDRIAAVNLVTPTTQPTGSRLWLRDGTVLDVVGMHWPDEDRPDVELITRWDNGTQRIAIRANRIAAMSFDGTRLLPLTTISPSSVEGPAYRYEIPAPSVLDRHALLGLSSMALRGPLTVRYALPEGCLRFAAEVSVPKASRAWCDFEIVIRINDEEVHRQRLDALRPQHLINVPITGRELTIELTDGTYGSIHNHIHLLRPRLLIE